MTMEKVGDEIAIEVDRLSKLGMLKLQQGQHQKAAEVFRNAYHSAISVGQNNYMHRACAFNLAAILISTRNFADGLIYLHQAVPPEGCSDGKSNGDLYFNFGLAYEGIKNLIESKHYFEKALEEYKLEENNQRMEANTIHRLGKLCVENGLLQEAESWITQLIEIYDRIGERDKQLMAQVERANLLHKMEKDDEAIVIVDSCFEETSKRTLSETTGKLYNELGLAYSVLMKYDQAQKCYEKALQVLQSSDEDLRLAAVIHQNLGALYNQMGLYEDAMKFHQESVKKHGFLKNRRSQGHSFINMGYAYSQLGEIDKAGESYLHALQAARDSDDTKTEWQSLESLGAVAFNQGKISCAEEYYKQALTVIYKSSTAGDKVIQERILGKLINIIKLQNEKPEMKGPDSAAHAEKSSPESRTALTRPKSEDGSVIAIKREGKVKYLKVRRSGTLRRFRKVALGIDANLQLSNLDTSQTLSSQHQESVDRALSGLDVYEDKTMEENIDEEDIEEVIDDEDIEEEEESDADKKEVLALMANINERNQSETPENIEYKESAGHYFKVDKSEDESSVDSSGTYDSVDTSRIKDPPNRSSPPPVPSTLPPPTLPPRTYEIPNISELHYETIDFSSQANRVRSEALENMNKESSQVYKGDKCNFFQSEVAEGPSIRAEEERMDTIEEASQSSKEADQQLLAPPSELGPNEVDDSGEIKLNQLSRAEREIILFQKHNEHRNQKKTEVEEKPDQKSSRHCLLM
ncbi:tetratricopeptide repeat protein 24-like isoform X2 [Physella acuta]|uniref:tetratricopeptide repeat protein 24-like isoform X2 n=1 Tax=Physella acuta TaxID=109671 RepID=UPI0027DC9985|nr:tetratricopeptide repeat protein 24-like isoform X2 [Physella acuta]